MIGIGLVLALGAAAMFGVAGALLRVQGTTLVAPAMWALAALAAVTAVETALAAPQPASLSGNAGIYRYLAGAALCCPLLALLGAKRPQNRAWGWIVLSLWVVLALPALEAWLFQRGRFELSGARAWFLLILIVTAMVNHLATRYLLSAGLVSLGQVLLMAEFLPTPLTGTASPRGALACFAVAVLAGWLVPTRNKDAVDRVWLDFRDAFGLVWSLRVQERLNDLATAQSWPVRLTWRGFVPLEAKDVGNVVSTSDAERLARDALAKALWRFVSPAWLAAREAVQPDRVSAERPSSAD
jgi:hypothetical protein